MPTQRLCALALLAGLAFVGCAIRAAPRVGKQAQLVGGPRIPDYMETQPRVPVSTPDPHFPTIRRVTLAHSLQLYVVKQTAFPLVTVTVAIAAGAADEPAPGVACLTVELLDEGAGQRDALQLSAAVESLGARLTVECGWQWTLVTIDVLSEHLGRAVALLADVVMRPHLDQRSFVRVRDELQGRSVARRSEPSRVAQLVLRSVALAGYALGRPLLPSPARIAALRRVDVLRFYRRRLRPAISAVVVAGDVDVEHLQAHINRYLASDAHAKGSRGAGASVRKSVDHEDRQRPRIALVHRANASQSVIRVGHRAPGRAVSGYAALHLVNLVLGGSFTSRLNQNLRERHGFTYGAHSHWWVSRQLGLFWVATAVETDKTLPVLEEIFGEMRKLRNQPMQATELDKAKNLALEQLGEQTESVAALARSSMDQVRWGLPVEGLQRLTREIRRVQLSQAREAAKRLLDPSRATVVIVGDMNRLGALLQQRFGRIERYDVDGRLR